MNPPPQAAPLVALSADVAISPTAAGEISIAPPTFLERRVVLFVACVGSWILLVGTGLLIYYFTHQPAFPSIADLSVDQAGDTLALDNQISDQWRRKKSGN